MKDTRQISFRLPSWLHRLARIKSAETDTPLSEVARRAIEEWIHEDGNGNKGVEPDK